MPNLAPSAPLPALLAHRYRTRQPVSTRELHPRAGLHAYGNLASDGTAHGATTSALARREKSQKYREVSQAPLAGITPGLPRGRTAHGNRRDLPRIGTARNLARG
jgi:hypothetical protein